MGGWCMASFSLGPEPSYPSLLWLSLGVALMVAAYDLWRDRVPLWVAAGIDRVSMPLFSAMTRLHSGIVGGYLAWITGGWRCSRPCSDKAGQASDPAAEMRYAWGHAEARKKERS